MYYITVFCTYLAVGRALVTHTSSDIVCVLVRIECCCDTDRENCENQKIYERCQTLELVRVKVRR